MGEVGENALEPVVEEDDDDDDANIDDGATNKDINEGFSFLVEVECCDVEISDCDVLDGTSSSVCVSSSVVVGKLELRGRLEDRDVSN